MVVMTTIENPAIDADEQIDTDDGEHDRFTHIVLKGALQAAAHRPVRALCGKVWRPGRDPKKYPLCLTCRDIAVARGWKVPIQ